MTEICKIKNKFTLYLKVNLLKFLFKQYKIFNKLLIYEFESLFSSLSPSRNLFTHSRFFENSK